MAAAYIADFYSDWVNIMRKALKELGVAHAPNLDDQQISLTFWNARLRFVGVVPRTVRVAREFQCPPALQADLDALTKKFEAGDDVNPHLSKGRLDASGPNFNDGLFNDWRIQHFHLGRDGKRGGDCLFAVVRSEAVYYIGIYPHGVYGEVELVERVTRNWPMLLGPKLTIPPTLTPPTAREITAARKAGVTTLTQLSDGTVLYPPGGGITTAKTGTRVVDVSDAAFVRMAYWQDWFDAHASDGIGKARADGFVFGDPPTFKLGIDPGNVFYTYEETAKVRINLGQLLAVSIDD